MSLKANLEPKVDFWHYAAGVRRRRIKVLGGEAVFALESSLRSGCQDAVAYAGIGYGDREIAQAARVSYGIARHYLNEARVVLDMRERAGLATRCAAIKALRVTKIISPSQLESLTRQERRALACIARGYNDDEIMLRVTLEGTIPRFVQDVADRLELPANRTLLGTVALLGGHMSGIAPSLSATSSEPSTFLPNVEETLRAFAAQRPDAIEWE